MGTFDRLLIEDVTHWATTGSDGYGGFTFSAPRLMKGRWEERTMLFMNPENREAVSRAQVFLNDDVAEGDYLARGDLTGVADPTTIVGSAWIVRTYQRNSDLRNLQNIRKAVL